VFVSVREPSVFGHALSVGIITRANGMGDNTEHNCTGYAFRAMTASYSGVFES
jgi:hypothetical protein